MALPLTRVKGLAPLVGELPLHKQALALAWCDAEGAASVADVVAAGDAAMLVDAIMPAAEDEERLWALLDDYAR